MGSMLDVLLGLREGNIGIKVLRTVGYDDRIITLNCLVCYCLCQVDCQEHRVHLPTEWIKG